MVQQGFLLRPLCGLWFVSFLRAASSAAAEVELVDADAGPVRVGEELSLTRRHLLVV